MYKAMATANCARGRILTSQVGIQLSAQSGRLGLGPDIQLPTLVGIFWNEKDDDDSSSGFENADGDLMVCREGCMPFFSLGLDCCLAATCLE